MSLIADAIISAPLGSILLSSIDVLKDYGDVEWLPGNFLLRVGLLSLDSQSLDYTFLILVH